METIKIDGHNVPVDKADLFFDGETGKRLTDDEWDEQQKRIRETDPDAITWTEVEFDEMGADS